MKLLQNHASVNDKIENKFLKYLVPLTTSLIMIFRGRGLPWNSVWAEDGSVFFQQLSDLKPVETIFHTYAGYFFVLHRVLILPMYLIDITYLALFISIACFINYFLVSFVLFKCLKTWNTTGASTCLTLAIAFTPAAGFESLQNIANLQWFWLIAWTIFTVSLQSLSNATSRIYAIITILLSYSAPSLIFMWFLGKRLDVGILKNTKQQNFRWIEPVLLASSGLQMYLIFSQRIEKLIIHNWVGFVADGLVRILGVSLFGGLAFALNRFPFVLFIIPIYFSFLYFIFSSLRTQFRKGNMKPFAVFILLLVPTGMGVIAGATLFQDSLFQSPFSAERYFVTFSYACYFVLILWISQTKIQKNFEKLLKTLVVIVCCLIIAYNLAPDNSRSKVSFQHSMDEYRHDCMNSQSYESHGIVKISPPGWQIIYNCGS